MHYVKEKNQIYVYALPVLDSRMYIVIHDEDPGRALIIDPLVAEEAVPVLDTLSHADVLLTHSHCDHISGVNWLRRRVNSTLLCSECCAGKILDPHKNLAAFASILVMDKSQEEQKLFTQIMDLAYTCEADQTFDMETSFRFGSYLTEIIHTPGHSDCSQCIRLTTEEKGLAPEIVFTGDSLVNGYDVITRLPGGSKKDYQAITRPWLDALADDTLIMPGHGDWGTKKELFRG